MIERRIVPNVPFMSWETFCKEYPPYSVALDGFLTLGPMVQHKSEGGPRVNFNHHEKVVRDATFATCQQTLLALRTGLLSEFSIAGNPQMVILLNDCDEDASLSSFILENPARCLPSANLLLNRLVSMTGLMDVTSGLYPMSTEENILRELSWIYNPYRRARLNGLIDRRSTEEFNQVMTDVHSRIDSYLAGRGQQIDLKMQYEILFRGNGWVMLKEIDEQARYAFHQDGIRAFVSVRLRPDGNYTYSFGKMSQWIPFPIDKILDHCNEVEGLTGSEHSYGGGANTGGSPRATGTNTDPEQMFHRIETFLGGLLRG